MRCRWRFGCADDAASTNAALIDGHTKGHLTGGMGNLAASTNAALIDGHSYL